MSLAVAGGLLCPHNSQSPAYLGQLSVRGVEEGPHLGNTQSHTSSSVWVRSAVNCTYLFSSIKCSEGYQDFFPRKAFLKLGPHLLPKKCYIMMTLLEGWPFAEI